MQQKDNWQDIPSSPLGLYEEEASVNSETTDSIDVAKEIEKYVKKKVGLLIGKQESLIDQKQNFMDLGIDSNRLVGVANEFERELGVELYPTIFFEYQNIAELVGYLNDEYGNKLSQTVFKNRGGQGARKAVSNGEYKARGEMAKAKTD